MLYWIVLILLIIGIAALLGGTFVTIKKNKAEDAMLIPLSAVNYYNGNPYVYCYQDGTAVRTDIQAGIHDQDKIEILGGLEANSQVITSWSNELVDGAQVLVKEAGETE